MLSYCLCADTSAFLNSCASISGLVVEYIVAIDVTRVRFPADAMRLKWKTDCAGKKDQLVIENNAADKLRKLRI